MKILLLSPHTYLIQYLESFDDNVVHTTEPLNDKILEGVDFIISYGYRHIIKKPVLDQFEGRAINLHISYLPWNRGADPNLWSFLENTPKGVTIHYLDEGLDTGDIISQERIEWLLGENETLASSYRILTKSIEELFKKTWLAIRQGNVIGKPQNKNVGSYHSAKEKDKYYLHSGWNTPVDDIIGKANQLTFKQIDVMMRQNKEVRERKHE